MTPVVRQPQFLDAGDCALVVEFGTTVDPAINSRVLALEAALHNRAVQGIRELVPTYRSLMIHYDPLQLKRSDLLDEVAGLLSGIGDTHDKAGRRWILPCCYEGAHGEDVDEVASLTGLSRQDVVDTHAGAIYRIYMYGFAPGYCYLGGLPEALAISRRSTPRPPHKAGALLIGGGLASVASFAMPTGWYVMGQTPEQLYHPGRETPFLLSPGDTLQFEPVSERDFALMEARAKDGAVVARIAEEISQ